MRKTTLAIILLFTIYSSHSTTIIRSKDPLARDLMVPLFGTDKIISLENYSRLSIKEYQVLAGRKMSFKERIKLKTSQFIVKKMIRDDGTLNTAKVKTHGLYGRWHWQWGGFALGFLLVLGPIIALFFHDKYKWDRFWTAFATMCILVSLGVILVIAAIGRLWLAGR